MQAIERAVGQGCVSQAAWLTVVSVTYYCEHPAGYRSCIAPAADGFSAYVEIEGLVRIYAPQLFASLSQAQAWCLAEQRRGDLQQI